MQVSGVKNLSFNGITPQDIEDRARVLSDDQAFKDEIDAKLNPELFADILDGKLKKTENGRKVVNFLVSAAAFAATTLSFKRVIPKLRGAIGNRISSIATKAGKKAGEQGSQTMATLGDEIAKNGKKVASNGGDYVNRFLNKVLGETKAQKVSNGLSKCGVNSDMDLVDTAAALGVATFTSREAGDIVDEEHKEKSLKSAIRDIAKIAGSVGGEGELLEVL